MRLVILGRAGAGKTTLARRLAQAAAAPLICLDELSSASGVTPDQIPAFRTLMIELHAGEAWVSDGNFAATFDIRLPRADLIIWLEPPRWLCVSGCGARVPLRGAASLRAALAGARLHPRLRPGEPSAHRGAAAPARTRGPGRPAADIAADRNLPAPHHASAAAVIDR